MYTHTLFNHNIQPLFCVTRAPENLLISAVFCCFFCWARPRHHDIRNLSRTSLIFGILSAQVGHGQRIHWANLRIVGTAKKTEVTRASTSKLRWNLDATWLRKCGSWKLWIAINLVTSEVIHHLSFSQGSSFFLPGLPRFDQQPKSATFLWSDGYSGTSPHVHKARVNYPLFICFCRVQE